MLKREFAIFLCGPSLGIYRVALRAPSQKVLTVLKVYTPSTRMYTLISLQTTIALDFQKISLHILNMDVGEFNTSLFLQLMNYPFNMYHQVNNGGVHGLGGTSVAKDLQLLNPSFEFKTEWRDTYRWTKPLGRDGHAASRYISFGSGSRCFFFVKTGSVL